MTVAPFAAFFPLPGFVVKNPDSSGNDVHGLVFIVLESSVIFFPVGERCFFDIGTLLFYFIFCMWPSIFSSSIRFVIYLFVGPTYCMYSETAPSIDIKSLVNF